MILLYSRDFAKNLKRLPKEIQKLYSNQEVILQTNWCDPRLHLKQLRLKPVVFSFRITRDYRALFYFKSELEIVLFDVRHRQDVYRKLP